MRRLSLCLLPVLVLAACAPAESRGNGEGPGAPPIPAPVQASGSGSEPAQIPANADSLTCWTSATAPSESPAGISFRDRTAEMGLDEPLRGMRGHAAAFGAVDGDTVPDLVVGTFGDRPVDDYRRRGADGPTPDRLLVGAEGGYGVVAGFPGSLGRTSGAVFADLDADADADLLLVRHAGLSGQSDIPTQLFENRGGTLRPIDVPLPAGFLGRSPVVADFDADGLLDVFVTEDRYGTTGSRLLRNEGGLSFTDITSRSGIGRTFALGAAAGDIDRDGHMDLVTSETVFRGLGDLTFEEVAPAGWDWEMRGPDDDPAGVAIGDVTGDALPDVVVGHHYRSTVETGSRVPVRLFVNRGSGLELEDVTSEVGLQPLPSPAPHVELADIDNDGHLDIVTSALAAGGTTPAVFRNSGRSPVWFEAPDGLGSEQYWVGAPVADVDHDGRQDVFALEWDPGSPSRLFHNATVGGHWLQVSMAGAGQGVGAIVTVSSLDGALIGSRQISVSGGYASGTLPVAHVGVGDAEAVDVSIARTNGETISLGRVPVDRHLRWPAGC